MGDDTKNIQDSQAKSQPSSDSDTSTQTQNKDPQSQSADPPKTQKVFAEEQITDLIEKARADEKKKVFSKLESLKKANEEYQTKLAELEAMRKEIEADRDALREGRSSEFKSVNEELSQLREQNEKLQKAFEASVESATMKIREQELKAYKAEKLREAQVSLVELVSGSSESEIDASIEAAKKREKAIEESLREQIRKELANDLPQPMSTDGSQGRGPTPVITPQNRQAVARLKGDEYERRRQELLEDAKTKAGWTT